jgi:hypothetical protein
MARLGTAIDIQDVDRSADMPRELLPFGDYLMELVAIDPKVDGANVSHAYTYEVIEPEEFKKRRIWDWIDLENPGMEWKVKKGWARLANLCDSIGYDTDKEGRLEDDEVLQYRAFMAKVIQEPGGVSKAGKEFKPKNVVSRFYKPDDKDAPAQANIYADQPALPAAPTAANDNVAQRRGANDNAPAQAARPAAAAGARPWGARK